MVALTDETLAPLAVATLPEVDPSKEEKIQEMMTGPKTGTAITTISSPEQIRALENLNPEQRKRAEALAASLNTDEPMAIERFGIDTQNQLNKVLNPELKRIAARDAGPVGDLLGDLLKEVKSINPVSIGKRKSLLSKLPIIKNMVDEVEKIKENMQSVEDRIDGIILQIRKHGEARVQDINRLQVVYDMTVEAEEAQMEALAACEIKLDELRVQHQKLQVQAQASGDIRILQRVTDLADQINRLKNKARGLQTTSFLAYISLPQIRMTQAADRALVCDFEQQLTVMIPEWVRQVYLQITAFGTKQSAALTKSYKDWNDKLIGQGAELFNQAATEAAIQTNRATVSIEVLDEARSKIIATIQSVTQIQRDGDKQRIEEARKLDKMREDFKQELLKMESPFAT